MLQQWLERDARVIWHGYTQMTDFAANEPLIVQEAEGHELIDVDGRRYIDAISSLWISTFGHRVPQLDEALRQQLDRVAHSTNLGNGNAAVVELAEALAEIVPMEQSHFVFGSDGSTAVEQALEIAIQYWGNRGISGRTKFLTLEGAFHGDTIGSASIGSDEYFAYLGPLRFDVIRTAGYRDPNWLTPALQALDQHKTELAGVVIEPLVQGAKGMEIANPGDVERLGDACAEAGVLLICDEVATGFGRTGTLFASEQCNISPDIMTIGKSLTGGYLPMSATITSQAVYEAFLGDSNKAVGVGHTYSGNALAAAVALRNVQLIQETDVLANVNERSEQLSSLLKARAAELPISVDIRIAGLMCGIELHSPSPDLHWGRLVTNAMVRRGVFSRPLGDVLILVPPLSITSAEIEKIVDATISSVTEVCGPKLSISN